jgi:hypothetical protein
MTTLIENCVRQGHGRECSKPFGIYEWITDDNRSRYSKSEYGK